MNRDSQEFVIGSSSLTSEATLGDWEGIRDLPENWKTTQLGAVATLSSKPPHLALGSDAVVPFIPMHLVPQDGSAITRWELRRPPEVRSGVYFCDGDVLVAKITPCLENGKQGVARKIPGGWGYASTEIYPIHPNTGIDTDFVAAYLRLTAVRTYLMHRMEGTTGRKRLPKTVLMSLPIPLPPLPEQRAIARVLRTVQEAKEATEKVIAATRELKKSLMRHLFTYGPVPLDQVDQVPLKETEIGLVPEAWEVQPLRDCAKVQTGIAKGRKISDAEAVDVPYLRVANVQDGYLNLAEIKTIRIARSEIPRYQLIPGDVLVTEGGDMDKLGRGFLWQGQVSGAVHQNHVFAIRADTNALLPEYLAYFVQSSVSKSYFLNVAHRTTHLACINSTKLKALPTVLPSLPEQRDVVQYLRAVDSKIEAEESWARTLDSLFNSLLHNLMTGRIRVPATWADGYPAEGVVDA